MKLEHDSEVDGLFIWFVNNIDKESNKYSHEVWPQEFNEEIGLLFDKENRLMGIEVMPASKYFSESLLGRDHENDI